MARLGTTVLTVQYSRKTGHILISSPKYHPELAGVGIEYSWGKAKLEFRRNINDCVPTHLRENVKKALDISILSLERVRRFARRTRDYKRVYEYIRDHESDFNRVGESGLIEQKEGEKLQGHKMIESMRKKQKEHRCIMNLDTAYINKS